MNRGLKMLSSNTFLRNLWAQLDYSTGEIQALQLTVRVVFGAVEIPLVSSTRSGGWGCILIDLNKSNLTYFSSKLVICNTFEQAKFIGYHLIDKCCVNSWNVKCICNLNCVTWKIIFIFEQISTFLRQCFKPSQCGKNRKFESSKLICSGWLRILIWVSVITL